MQLAAQTKAQGSQSMTASLAAPASQWEIERSILVDNQEVDGESLELRGYMAVSTIHLVNVISHSQKACGCLAK